MCDSRQRAHKCLIEKYGFYGEYHKNTINRIIHIITIPVMIWTILVFCGYCIFYTPSMDTSLSPTRHSSFNLNLGLIPLILCSSVYMFMDFVAGLTFFILVSAEYILACIFVAFVPYAWTVALDIHIFAWICQFIGHSQWIENKSLALFDGPISVFTMAPLFVVIEVISILFLLRYRSKKVRGKTD